ncbi:MAG: DUF488 domain-containing protein [Pirellulaceae bacterium]|mgnify:CR=1 FL=1|nr:DUF488 domain-containing protein [Pirellulaceae bacterium]
MASNQTSTQDPTLRLFTIGFAGHSAEEFFEKLRTAGVRKVVDVRLNNVSQLAGFAKKNDLAYFLRVIGQIDYAHEPNLAPTKEILDDYKKKQTDWEQYKDGFLRLLDERNAAATLDPKAFDRACLLCSEHEHEHCHRSLVADYLRQQWRNVEIVHL